MNTNAEILLIRKDGAVILPVSGKKPGDTRPEAISSFGDHIQDGEEPIDTAVRVINEATNLNLKKEQLQLYRKLRKTQKVQGRGWDAYYFVACNINTEHLTIHRDVGYTVISNKHELSRIRTTTPLKQVLTDYFDGYRSFIFLPDMNESTKQKLFNGYYEEITGDKKPSAFPQPIALACTGLSASGKSSITAPLAQEIGAVTVSSDKVREIFFKLGYNFKQVYSLDTHLIEQATKDRYNIFLDFNASTNIHVLDKLKEAGYRVLVVHANPPYSFVEHKILSGNARRAAVRKGEVMTFFPNDKFLYQAMLAWKDEHMANLQILKERYGIWFEADTSNGDASEIAKQVIKQFRTDMTFTPE